MHKVVQSGGFLGKLLGALFKIGLPLMKNILRPLAKSVLKLLKLTTAASRTDAAIQKKFLDQEWFHLFQTKKWMISWK